MRKGLAEAAAVSRGSRGGSDHGGGTGGGGVSVFQGSSRKPRRKRGVFNKMAVYEKADRETYKGWQHPRTRSRGEGKGTGMARGSCVERAARQELGPSVDVAATPQ